MAELINNSKTYEFVISWGRLMCLEIGVYLTPSFLRIRMFSLVVLDVGLLPEKGQGTQPASISHLPLKKIHFLQ
jgi:hypothetical protein